MIVLDCPQGSEAWEQARLGIPTASCFDQILTPAKLEYSKGSTKYRNRLLAEWLLGHPLEAYQSAWMEHGSIEEPKARAYYEMLYDVEVQPVGFVLRGDGQVGGSPDGFVGEDGGLEIKCPAPHTHVAYMLDNRLLASEYRHQCQGNLYLSGRKWWDIISYCSDLPAVTVRVERDEAYIAALDAALAVFVADLNEAKDRLAQHKLPSYAAQLAEAAA